MLILLHSLMTQTLRLAAVAVNRCYMLYQQQQQQQQRVGTCHAMLRAAAILTVNCLVELLLLASAVEVVQRRPGFVLGALAGSVSRTRQQQAQELFVMPKQQQHQRQAEVVLQQLQQQQQQQQQQLATLQQEVLHMRQQTTLPMHVLLQLPVPH
jgi:hypothetical protein